MGLKKATLNKFCLLNRFKGNLITNCTRRSLCGNIFGQEFDSPHLHQREGLARLILFYNLKEGVEKEWIRGANRLRPVETKEKTSSGRFYDASCGDSPHLHQKEGLARLILFYNLKEGVEKEWIRGANRLRPVETKEKTSSGRFYDASCGDSPHLHQKEGLARLILFL